MLPQSTATAPGIVKRAGPRTRMGAKRIRAKDLVLVADPRDSGAEFVACVTGGFTLKGSPTWHLTLERVIGDPRQLPRSATTERCVKRVWHRATR